MFLLSNLCLYFIVIMWIQHALLPYRINDFHFFIFKIRILYSGTSSQTPESLRKFGHGKSIALSTTLVVVVVVVVHCRAYCKSISCNPLTPFDLLRIYHTIAVKLCLFVLLLQYSRNYLKGVTRSAFLHMLLLHSDIAIYNVVGCLSVIRIRHDTIRDAILTCARKPTWVSLIYRTETTTKKCKTEKKLKSKGQNMLRSNSKQSGESM